MATTNPLNGKTATELRAMIASKEVTAKEVLAYLVGKGDNIRRPSKLLRDELAGVKPAATPKAEAPKPAATPKAATPKATPTPTPTATATPTPTALAVALEALRAATAAVEALLAAQAAEAPTAKPVEPPKAKPVESPKATAKAVVEPATETVADEDEDAEDAEISEDDVREHLAGLTVRELRELADSEDLPTTGNRAQLTDRLVAVLCPPPVQATANKPAASKPAAPKASAKGKVTLASAAAEIEDF
jgi:hypothetical protein